MVIPMALRDGVDVSGRLMAEELAKLLKGPIFVLNKLGARGGAEMNYCLYKKMINC